MKYCKRCLYPANHPLYITFDSQGVCSGCRVHEEKDYLAWDARKEKLTKILRSYRDKSGNYYDCIIPVRGGGDSYFITHVITKLFKMNPLLVTFNHEYNTKIGIRNLANLLTVFDCDHINYTIDPSFIKRLAKHSLKKYGSIYWHVLAGTLTFPVQIAVNLRIPLIVWGVNGWMDQVGMFSHVDEVEMTKKVRKEHALLGGIDAEDMIDEKEGISSEDIERFMYPSDKEIEEVGVRGIYLGNYIRWDSKKQHEQMIELYGYETSTQERTFNTYEDVDCFHSAGTHDYIKFLKYGYGKVTDHATREIRLKRMTREEGIELVKKYESKKPADLSIFLNWIGMTEEEFYACIEPFRDPKIWKRNNKGEWYLLDSIINHLDDEGVNEVRLEKNEDCKFILTPSKEPNEPEKEYILMGRGYINKYNYKAIEDNQDNIFKELEKNKQDIKNMQMMHDSNVREDNREKRRYDRKDNGLSYCRRCVLPNTKPGVFFDENGICNACRSVEQKKQLDWKEREKELKELCDSVRGSNGNGYDCLVPVSGGKDSHFQVWMMKVVYKMNVLAVCVVPHIQTREGIANLNNLVKTFNTDLIKISLKPSVFRRLRRKTFFEIGEPNWSEHASVYSAPSIIACVYHIPLIVWGEDIAVEFGGRTANKRESSAEDLMRNDAIKGITVERFYNEDILSKHTFFYKEPPKELLRKKSIRSIYLGYYVNWSGPEHYNLSKNHGFQNRRLGPLSGNIIDYDNIDEKLCEINIWFKFLKFGFWRPTDQCCYQIWNNMMSREKAVELVNAKQYDFPVEYFKDFLEFHEISEEEFWRTVDKYRNRDIWQKINGEWRLKVPLK